MGNTTNSTDTAAATAAKPPSRRWLHRASKDAFRKGAELFQGSSTSTSTSTSSMVGTTSQALNMNTNSHRNDDDDTNHRLVSTPSSKSKSTEETRSQRQLIRKNRLLPDAKAEADASDTNATVTKKTYGENDIVPGRGWVLHGWTPVKGFCDGSPQSECNRGDPNNCLMAGANDKHYDVIGDSLSGWLVFTIPKVVEGIILIRMEWWCASVPPKGTELSKDWTEVNGGKTFDTTPFGDEMPFQRRLRDHSDVFYDDNNDDTNAANDAGDSSTRKLGGSAKKEINVPLDFEFDHVINNGVVKTMDREEWLSYTVELSKNVAVFPLLNDETMAQQREDRKNRNGQDESDDDDGEPIEVAVRFRSKLVPKQAFCISHVYYA